MKNFFKLSILSIFIFILSVPNYITKASDSNIIVEDFLNGYFQEYDESLANLQINSSISDYYDESNILDYLTLDTIVEHRKIQISDLRYSNYSTCLTFKEIRYENDLIIIDVIKNTDIYFNCLRGEESNIIENHLITIKNVDNTYKIISDVYNDDIRNYLLEEYLQVDSEEVYQIDQETLSINQKQLLNESTSIVNKQRSNMQKVKSDAEKFLNFSVDIKTSTEEEYNKSNDISRAGFSFYSYNREAAKSYAYQYVLTPNTSYANFETLGGNCTNFTSQCLKAGGITSDQTGNYTWYYNSSSDRAPAWAKADLFRTYYLNNVGSSSVKGLRAFSSDFDSMRLGDLVQLVSSDYASHTMFISSAIYDNWGASDPWVYKYDVGICQNSTSASSRLKNVPLSTKPSNREYIHIEGSYY